MSFDFANKMSHAIAPYVPGEQPEDSDTIKLNTNENPYPPSSRVVDALRKIASDNNALRKYPHALGEPLRSAISRFHDVPVEYILVGNGSDEILNLLCRSHLDTSRTAAASNVTYSLYETLVSMASGKWMQIDDIDIDSDQNPFSINLQGLAECKAELIFVPNPNAQTGEFIETDRLLHEIKKSDKLWIIDEAYNDFVPGQDASMAGQVKTHQNLCVIRTFSKSHSLAGLRIGYILTGNQHVIKAMLALKDSYNLTAASAAAALAALKDHGYYQQIFKNINESREKLTEQLRSAGFSVIPSAANFILVKPPEIISSCKLYEELKEQKILVRYFADSKIEDYVRITIGNENENFALMKAIKKILSTD